MDFDCENLVVERKVKKDFGCIWWQIVDEEKEMQDLYEAEKRESANRPRFECKSNYLIREVFPQLRSALLQTHALILSKDAINNPDQFFNGIDAVAEFLYKNNTRCPEKLETWTSIYDVFDTCHRKPCPLHWVLTPDEAATMIQAMIRGFLVRRRGLLEKLRLAHSIKCEIERNRKRCEEALAKNDPKRWDAVDKMIEVTVKQTKLLQPAEVKTLYKRETENEKGKKKKKSK